jgi:hypothetical protein
MATAKRWRYSVTGSGVFPLDMTRYDACFPSGQDDVTSITRSFDRRNARDQATRTVRLRSTVKEPTEGRWESFGWKVSEVSTY